MCEICILDLVLSLTTLRASENHLQSLSLVFFTQKLLFISILQFYGKQNDNVERKWALESTLCFAKSKTWGNIVNFPYSTTFLGIDTVQQVCNFEIMYVDTWNNVATSQLFSIADL